MQQSQLTLRSSDLLSHCFSPIRVLGDGFQGRGGVGEQGKQGITHLDGEYPGSIGFRGLGAHIFRDMRGLQAGVEGFVR